MGVTMEESKIISFFAMLHRMKYIERWGLMRNSERENLKEHTFDVALLAHALAEIRNLYYPNKKPYLNPGDVVLYALYHDASEIITGDMPTPVKYFNPNMRSQYKEVEEHATEYLLSLLPSTMRQRYSEYFDYAPANKMRNQSNLVDKSSEKKAHIIKLVKQADTLSAYIKCIEEIKQGNNEFIEAAESTKNKLLAYNSAELDWFIENILPSYELSLDQLRPDFARD